MEEFKDLSIKVLKGAAVSAVIASLVYFIFPKVEIIDDSSFDENEVAKKETLQLKIKNKKSATSQESQVIVSPPTQAPQKTQSPSNPLPPYEPISDSNVNYAVSGNSMNTTEYQRNLNSYYEQSYEPPLERPLAKKEDTPALNPVLASFLDTHSLENPAPEKKKEEETNNEVPQSGGGTYVSVSADKPAGTYSDPPLVTLKLFVNGVLSSDGNIFYCVEEDGSCCDVLASSATYTAPISLGANGDKEYCLSFYAKSFAGLVTTPAQLKIKIDSTLPSKPITATETLYLQTTERYVFKFPPITYSGTASGTILSLYSLDDDPTENPNCTTVAAGNTALNVDGIGGADYIDFNAYLLSAMDLFLFYYNFSADQQDYYIVSTVTKPHLDTPLSNCSSTHVRVEDFPAFSSLSLHKTVSSAGGSLSGGFTPYGFFKDSVTSTKTSGLGRERELHSDFLDTVN